MCVGIFVAWLRITSRRRPQVADESWGFIAIVSNGDGDMCVAENFVVFQRRRRGDVMYWRVLSVHTTSSISQPSVPYRTHRVVNHHVCSFTSPHRITAAPQQRPQSSTPLAPHCRQANTYSDATPHTAPDALSVSYGHTLPSPRGPKTLRQLMRNSHRHPVFDIESKGNGRTWGANSQHPARSPHHCPRQRSSRQS